MTLKFLQDPYFSEAVSYTITFKIKDQDSKSEDYWLRQIKKKYFDEFAKQKNLEESDIMFVDTKKGSLIITVLIISAFLIFPDKLIKIPMISRNLFSSGIGIVLVFAFYCIKNWFYGENNDIIQILENVQRFLGNNLHVVANNQDYSQFLIDRFN